jgi:hypothetical protein
MLALLGDRLNAIAELEYSLRHHPSQERRSRAINLTRLAGLQLRQGLLEQAIETWHRFLDDYPAINSGRARTAFGLLPASIRPHQSLPAGSALLARATSLQRLPHVALEPFHLPAVPPQDMEGRSIRPVQGDLPFVQFCENCGTPLKANGTGRPRRHCGPACRQRAYRARKTPPGRQN